MSIHRSFHENNGKQMWIGTVGVRTKKGNEDLLGFAKGAYVNVLAIAADERDYRAQILEALHEMGFELVELEDVELARQRSERIGIEQPLLGKMDEVQETGYARFGTFYTFEAEDN
jgi:acetylornithine/succinyldiaminopimelate/putrescine aminotransferase